MGKTRFDFNGQTVLVTGATRGIGRGIAEAFAEAGASVYLIGTNGERGAAAEQAIRERGGHVRFLPCDVTVSRQVSKTFERVLAESGRLDVLVNNAGGWKNQQSIAETPEEEWDATVALNLKSVFLCARAAIPIFKRQRSGRVINVTSIGSLTIAGKSYSSPPYVASKAAVNSLTRLMAAELGEYGVTANALAPSTTITERIMAVRSDAQRGNLGDRTALGRLAEVEDIAYWALFLAAPESAYLTGQTISVNGGRFMA